MKTNIVILSACCLLFPAYALSDAMSATQVMERAESVKRVDDQIATLTFSFQTPDQPKQKAVYRMVWKNMRGVDGYDDKAMFFTLLPVEKRGIAYLGWLRPDDSKQADDEWIYLPELRMTRRIAQRDHEHAHDDDEFGLSILQHEHLDPRAADADDHTLLQSDAPCNTSTCYLIASTPKHGHDHNHQHTGKLLRWIDKEKFLAVRQQFLDAHDNLTVDMDITWQEQQGYWLWQRIVAQDAKKERTTTLEITDIKVNTGLKDRDFSKKALEKGWRLYSIF